MKLFLTGWARLWIVVSLVWLLCVIPILAVIFPYTNTTAEFVSEQQGRFWTLNVDEAHELAYLTGENPRLADRSTETRFVIASQVVRSNADRDNFGLSFKHSVFVNDVTPHVLANSGSEVSGSIQSYEFLTAPSVAIIQEELAAAFPDRADADVELTAKAIVEEIDIVEREWPARIAEDIEIRNDQKMTAWISGGAIVLIPPILVWLLFFVVRWIYRGFRADKDTES